MLAAPRTALSAEITDVASGICWNCSSSLKVTASNYYWDLLPLGTLWTSSLPHLDPVVPSVFGTSVFLMFLLSDVAVCWDSHIDHNCSLLLLAKQH